jgi:hypothetical protein
MYEAGSSAHKAGPRERLPRDISRESVERMEHQIVTGTIKGTFGAHAEP